MIAIGIPGVDSHRIIEFADKCFLANIEQWCQCIEIENEISTETTTPTILAVTLIRVHALIANGDWMLRNYHCLKNTAIWELDVCDNTYKYKCVDTTDQHDIIIVVFGNEAFLDLFCNVEQNILLSNHQFEMPDTTNANFNRDADGVRSGLRCEVRFEL